MKKIKILILLLLIVNHTNAIKKNPDMLSDLHSKEELKDPILFEIDSLEILCWSNRISEPVLAISYANQAYEKALEIKSYKDLACIHNYISVILRHYNYSTLSSLHIKKALEISNDNQIPREKTYAYLNQSNFYYKRGEYDSATSCIYQALEIAKKSLNNRAIAYCYYQSAENEISMGEYSIASGYLKRAWEYSSTISNKTSLHFSIVISLANNYINCGMPLESRKYLIDNFNIDDFELNDFDKTRYWLALGRLYETENKLDSTFIAYKKSYEYSTLCRIPEIRISALNKLGETYMSYNKYKESAECFKNAFNVADSSYKSVESFAEAQLRKFISIENSKFVNKYLTVSNNDFNIKLILYILILLFLIVVIIYQFYQKKKLRNIIYENSSLNINGKEIEKEKTNLALKITEKRYQNLQYKHEETEQFLHFINNYLKYDIQNPLNIIIKTQRKTFSPNMTISEIALTFEKMDAISSKYILILDYLQKLISIHSGMLQMKIEIFQINDYIQNVVALFKAQFLKFNEANFEIEDKNDINVYADKSFIKDSMFIINYTILYEFNCNKIFINYTIDDDFILIFISTIRINNSVFLIKDDISLKDNLKSENSVLALCKIFCKENLEMQLGNFDFYYTGNKELVFKIKLPISKK